MQLAKHSCTVAKSEGEKQEMLHFIDLLFPNACLQCGTHLTGREVLCAICSEQLHLQPAPIHISPFLKRSSLFPYYGTAATVIDTLTRGNAPYLSRGCAALLLLRFEQLRWPLPDCITFVPQTPIQHLKKGYNPSELIARHLSVLLNCPFRSLLHKSSESFSQEGLSYQQREAQSPYTYHLKKGAKIADQRILLIDTVSVTGTTLENCAAALQEGTPYQIEALTVCFTKANLAQSKRHG